MHVRILGPLEVLDAAGRPVPLGPPKQRAVLALLALTPWRVVSADRIVDELWGERVPATATNTVQAYVSRLRRALGAAAIVTRAGGYQLEGVEVDAIAFEEAVAAAGDLLDEGDAAGAAARVREALSTWRGPALADVRGVQACEREAARLDDVRLRAVEDLLEADLQCGRHVSVASEAASVVAEHPLRERMCGLRMLALYRSGRQAEALACFADLRTRLADELGLDPASELRQLEEAILRQDASLEWTPRDTSGLQRETEPPATPPPTNVPAAATSFVGRGAEVAAVTELLTHTRIVTVTGTGGAGKTRLAMEVAASVRSAWFVPLADVTDASQVAEHVAMSLSVRPGSARESAITDALRLHHGLVVLDNCEHQLAACAELAVRIVAACPGVQVMATSREPLRAKGESVYRVPPLAVPDAARLFADRARDASGVLDGVRYGPSIDGIVRKLDGIPLAIELAAARTDVLTPPEIEERLQDVLTLLTHGPTTGDARHRTLRATLAWSHDALTEEQQRLLHTLAVFAGGFTVTSAEAVYGGEVLDGLSRLVALSLVDATDENGTKRFSMLETTRHFALEQLEASGEAAAVRRRHLELVAALVASVGPQMTGPGQVVAATTLDAEMDNIRAGLTFALAEGHDTPAGVRMAAALGPYWQLRGHLAEARRWLEMADAGAPSTIGVLMQLGGIRQMQGDLDAAAGHFTDTLEEARRSGQNVVVASALTNLSSVSVLRGELDDAHGLLAEAASAARAADARPLLATVLNNLAQVVRRQGDIAAARTIYEEALELARGISNPLMMATILLNLGEIERMTGAVGAARRLLDDALALSRKLGYGAGVATCLGALGNLAREEGDGAAARERYAESVEAARRMGATALVAAGTANLAGLAQNAGDLEDAAARFAEYRSLSEQMGDARGVLQARRGLAEVALARHDVARAIRLLQAALRGAIQLGQPDELAETLDAAAAVARARDEEALAVRWSAAGDALRSAAGLPATGGGPVLPVADVMSAPDEAAAWLRSAEPVLVPLAGRAG